MRMSEFKVEVIIYALLHIIRIIRYFIVTQYPIGSLADIMMIKKHIHKIKPTKLHNPKIKIEH